MDGLFFCYAYRRGDGMNIAKFIKDHKELDNLPFLIVFRTMTVLKELGMLKTYGGDTDVEKTQ